MSQCGWDKVTRKYDNDILEQPFRFGHGDIWTLPRKQNTQLFILSVFSRDPPSSISFPLSGWTGIRVPNSLALTQYDGAEKSFGDNVSGYRKQA